jgi:hypothetical protein
MARHDHFHATVKDNETGEVFEVEGGWHSGNDEALAAITPPADRKDYCLGIISDWAPDGTMLRLTNSEQASRYHILSFNLCG